MTRLGIVCEGLTDVVIITELIDEISPDTSYRVIKPYLDATTGEYESWGWTNIRLWCERNSGRSVEIEPDFFRAGAPGIVMQTMSVDILTQSSVETICIQMDTDIAEKIDTKRGFTNYMSSVEGASRRNYCEKYILKWLKTDARDDLFLILPTMALETWIIAVFDRTNAHDVFGDSEVDYLALDPKKFMGDLSRCRHIKSKEKTLKNYRDNLWPVVRDGMEKIKERCPEFLRLTSFLSSDER